MPATPGVQSVCELMTKRKLVRSQWSFTGSRQFRVIIDPAVTTDEIRIMFAEDASGNRVPYYGDPYPLIDPFGLGVCFVQDVTAAPEANDKFPDRWLVDVSYATVPVDDGNPDPLARRYKPALSFSTIEKVIEKDNSGASIVNTAGQRYPEPVTEEWRTPVLTFRRNLAFMPFLEIRSYANSVNSDTVTIPWSGGVTAAPRTLKVTDLSLQPEQEANVEFFAFTMSVAVIDESLSTWDREILSNGYMEKVSGALKPILENARPIQEPALLSASGTKTLSPHYQSFRIRPEKPFNALGFFS